jgi:hypothetical protein
VVAPVQINVGSIASPLELKFCFEPKLKDHNNELNLRKELAGSTLNKLEGKKWNATEPGFVFIGPTVPKTTRDVDQKELVGLLEELDQAAAKADQT